MSKREYLVIGFEYGTPIQDGFSVTLEKLFNLGNNPTEVEITLAEQLDDCILDLNVGETAHVNLIRDDKNSKGVILRVK